MTFSISESQTEAEYKAVFEQASREMDAMFQQMDITPRAN